MTDIDKVLDDIKKLFNQEKVPEGVAVQPFIDFAAEVAGHVAKAIQPAERAKRDEYTIYASELGTKCARQLAYKIFLPEKAEPLHYSAKIKFLYGHILEALVLLLVKLAGHKVTHEQELVEWRVAGAPKPYVVRGRPDAVINGDLLVDVKSASPQGFESMTTRRSSWDDSFGYSEQVAFYANVLGIPSSELLLINKVSGELRGASVIIGKTSTTGGVTRLMDETQKYKLSNNIYDVQGMYASTHPKGRVLTTTCSYCAFKFDCWKSANGGKGLRVFKYATKPLFFVDVESSGKDFLSKEIKLEQIKEEEKENGSTEAIEAATPDNPA